MRQLRKGIYGAPEVIHFKIYKINSMDQVDAPNGKIWAERQEWFEAQFDVEERGGGYIIGEHASALLIDLQAVFCAGAFISVIILACTIADAHLREFEGNIDFDGGMELIFSELTAVEGLDWLRRRRNRLVHFNNRRGPEITVDHQWGCRDAHELDARRAILLLSKVIFENPFV